MNSDGPDQIRELLAKWLRLTEAESEAIQSETWANLEDIQLAKANLRPLISAAMEGDSRQSDSGRGPACFRPEFEYLIKLESRNRELLAQKMQAAAETKNSLQKNMHTLRRIHHSYAAKPDAAWHSYS